jgi:FAD/FMN-containing dehydrogenase
MAATTWPQTDPAEICHGVNQTSLVGDEAILKPLFERIPRLILHTKSSQHFEDARQLANLMWTTQPLAIIYVTSINQLAEVIRFAQVSGLAVGIRGRGHGSEGRCLVEGGITIDLSLLNGIALADDKSHVIVGGGTSSLRLLEFLDSHQLITPTGWCGDVGYAGYALGGGLGLLSSQYGLACDQILYATPDPPTPQ